MGFELDPRLAADTELLCRTDTITYLLHRNGEVVWCILVPHTDEVEFHRLEPGLQAHLVNETNRVAQVLEHHFPCNKINIATIGNLVQQLHVHVIARHRRDAYWPETVWGKPFERIHDAGICNKLQSLINAK